MFTYGNSMDQMFTWIYYLLINSLNDFTQYIGNMGADLFDNSIVKAILVFFWWIGVTVLIIGIVIAIAQFGIGYDSGKSNFVETLSNIIKAMMVTALFTTVPVKVFQLSISTESAISRLINGGSLLINNSNTAAGSDTSNSLISSISSFFTTMIAGNPVLSVIGSLAGGSSSSSQHIPTFMNLLFLIAFCYGFFKVLFGNLKRGAILMIQICTCPFYIMSLAMGYSDGFTGWYRQILGICFTAFLQNLLLALGLMVFQTQMVVGTGVMLAAAEVPRIAGRYGLETSVRSNFMQVSYAARSAMSLVKAIGR